MAHPSTLLAASWRPLAGVAGILLLASWLFMEITGSHAPQIQPPISPPPQPHRSPRPEPKIASERMGDSELEIPHQTVANLRAALANLLRTGNFERAEPLMIAWLHRDPEAAARFIAETATGDRRIDALRTAAREWAAISAPDAMSWALQLGDAEERRMVGEFVCYRVAEADPRSALILAAGAGFGIETPLIPDLSQQWAERELPQATQWVLAASAGPARDQMVTRLVLVLAKQDPAEAGRLAIEQIPEGPGQEEAAISVVYQWALRDPAGAARWVAQFPPGPLRDRAERELAGVAAQRGG